MTQTSWDRLDRQIIEKLKLRAQRHGRSLDEEIEVILGEVVAAEVLDKDILHQTLASEARERLQRARAKYMPTLTGSSPDVESNSQLQPLSQNTTRRHPQDVVAAFRQLRQDIGWQDVSIRELIEEGRRF